MGICKMFFWGWKNYDGTPFHLTTAGPRLQFSKNIERWRHSGAPIWAKDNFRSIQKSNFETNEL